MENSLVWVDQASASYRSLQGRPRPALENICLHLAPGEIHALVGRNGAGKTTLLRLVLGLLAAHPGKVRVLGRDPVTNRIELMREVGVMLDGKRALEPRLTGLENLLLKASIYKLAPKESFGRAKALLDYFNLPAKEAVNRYSRGMRQRLMLAVAVLHEPKVLLLDEPTLGLDVQGQDLLLRLIKEMIKRAGTVLMTSQEISFIERAATQVSALERGRIIATGKPLDVVNRLGYQPRVRIRVLDPAKMLHPLPSDFSWNGEVLEGPLSLSGLEQVVFYLRSTGAG
ncbi:MAG TPA: ABC transporter ATP-binding protein, partial [Meiothermus sp.]|nr:ABC transporter ATP-binding protein [Meiothermus sp.]